MDGNEVQRNATITQESRQHAKCLTHKHQVSLQRNLILKHVAAHKMKETQSAIRVQHLLQGNHECKELLLQLLQSADSGVPKKKKRKQALSPAVEYSSNNKSGLQL
jgi:hypothetical protein